MRLYPKKYFDDEKKPENARKQFPVKKSDVEHLINQALIWIVIVFLSVAVIKKIFLL